MNNAHPFCSWVHLKCSSSTRNTISLGIPNRALWIAGKWNDFSSPFRCNISFHLCILCILFPFLIISYCYSMILLVLNNNVKICNKINENIIISCFKYHLEINRKWLFLTQGKYFKILPNLQFYFYGKCVLSS